MKFPDFIHSQLRLPDTGAAQQQHAVGLLDALAGVAATSIAKAATVAVCQMRDLAPRPQQPITSPYVTACDRCS